MREFIGVGGVVLTADEYGSEEHPCVVLLPGIMQTRKVWVSAAKALAQAGRYVISLDCEDMVAVIAPMTVITV